MKLSPLLISGALAVAIGLPVAGCAQQSPAQSSPESQQQGAPGHHGGMMRRFQNLNLSDQQKTQIKDLMTQYRQAHPRGSQPDPQSRQQLNDQIMKILTPVQQAQFKADREKMRQEHPGGQGWGNAPAASPTPAA